MSRSDRSPDKEELDPELEQRVAALEAGPDAGSDFDGRSWFWLVLFGVILPVTLLAWAWFG
jgi:hypothetical protein